jgi:hypothetical protein
LESAGVEGDFSVRFLPASANRLMQDDRDAVTYRVAGSLPSWYVSYHFSVDKASPRTIANTNSAGALTKPI